MARLQASTLAALGLLLSALGPAAAFTFANQTAALLAFKASMLPLGPNWATALQVGGRAALAAGGQLPLSASAPPQTGLW